MVYNYDSYHFFWYGPLSQWHISNFKVNNKTFNCAEQYMMYSKAMLFKDITIANEILKTKSPKEQKSLGRKVSNFNLDKWNNCAKAVVYNGNINKFLQNPQLTQLLINTAPKLLVEASPNDPIWGIGHDEKTAITIDPKQWRGKNWLGIVLTRVRDDIIKNY